MRVVLTFLDGHWFLWDDNQDRAIGRLSLYQIRQMFGEDMFRICSVERKQAAMVTLNIEPKNVNITRGHNDSV